MISFLKGYIDRYKWLVNAKRAALEQMSVEQRFGLRVGNVLDDSPKSVFDFDRLIFYTDVKKNPNGVYETTDDCERKQFSEWKGDDSIDEIWCNKDAYKPIIREQFLDYVPITPGYPSGDALIRVTPDVASTITVDKLVGLAATKFAEVMKEYMPAINNANNVPDSNVDTVPGDNTVNDNESNVNSTAPYIYDDGEGNVYNLLDFDNARVKWVDNNKGLVKKLGVIVPIGEGHSAEEISNIVYFFKTKFAEYKYEDSASGKATEFIRVYVNCGDNGRKIDECYKYLIDERKCEKSNICCLLFFILW